MTHDDLEHRLRDALRHEADRINPADRWDQIHAMSHEHTEPGSRRPRWLAPVAAAAAVAALVGGSWALTRGAGSPDPGPVAASSTSPAPSASTHSPVASSPPAVAAAVSVTLPAYFVGPNGGNGDRWGLYREFLKGSVPGRADDAGRAKAALALAMDAERFSNTDGYLQPWSGTRVEAVSVTPSAIRVRLSNQGPNGFTKDQSRLAVQELVWTAQAAVGKGTIPVTFAVADGSTKLFGLYPTSRSYNRPSADQTYEDLATLWITAPERDQVLPSGRAVVAKGESCAFEGTSQWQLRQGSKVIRSGTSQATSGCPTRGAWQVDLGVLAPGSYSLRAFEVSMEDPKRTTGDTSRTFTVR